jgi:hypothetical protein
VQAGSPIHRSRPFLWKETQPSYGENYVFSRLVRPPG